MQIMTMMMMIMIAFLYTALADQGLECVNDYHNTFTCVWNASELNIPPETSCFINVTVKKFNYRNERKALMSADPSRPHIRTATVVYDNKDGIIISNAKLNEEVRCENYRGPLAEIKEHKAKESVVKASPPQKVEVQGFYASWSVPYSRTCEFEVQFRSAAQSWTDVRISKTDRNSMELPEELFLHQQYVIRVRAKLNLPKAVWSDWSKEYNWTSEVGQTPPTRPTPGVSEILGMDWSSLIAGFTLTGITLAVVLICAVLFRCRRGKCVQKNRSFYIPDPSKFFGDLNSTHEGNFTSWLGPILAHESFIKVDTELISPVKVLKQHDTCDSHKANRNSGILQERWEGTTKSSNFSNSTYFLSQSSKGPSDTLEPCSAHSSYGPAGGISGPETVLQRDADITRGVEEKDGVSELEISLKNLEKLRQDTQSPDSGFAGGAEDSMEESDLPSPLALNLLPHLPRDLPAPHPIMHPLLGFDHMAGLLRTNCQFPGLMDQDLQGLCGMIEPSSGDYMPVKNVEN